MTEAERNFIISVRNNENVLNSKDFNLLFSKQCYDWLQTEYT